MSSNCRTFPQFMHCAVGGNAEPLNPKHYTLNHVPKSYALMRTLQLMGICRDVECFLSRFHTGALANAAAAWRLKSCKSHYFSGLCGTHYVTAICVYIYILKV